jgi:hypothetical protein
VRGGDVLFSRQQAATLSSSCCGAVRGDRAGRWCGRTRGSRAPFIVQRGKGRGRGETVVRSSGGAAMNAQWGSVGRRFGRRRGEVAAPAHLVTRSVEVGQAAQERRGCREAGEERRGAAMAGERGGGRLGTHLIGGSHLSATG